MSAIHYYKNADNIVILTFDSPNQSANTMNADFRDALAQVVRKVKSRRTSGGNHFRLCEKKPFLQAVT